MYPQDDPRLKGTKEVPRGKLRFDLETRKSELASGSEASE